MHVAGTHPRGLRAAWCSCGAPVLQGVDEDLAAAIVKADPAPLSATGEAMARMNGRNTYDLRKDGGVFQLMRRNSLTIISRPPGSKIWCGMIDVLAEHRCGSGPLPGLPSVHPAPTPDTLGGSRACPF